MPEVNLGPRFDNALLYAKEAHKDQLRKGTAIPYFAHCLAVTAIVLEHGGDEDEAIAALLHDTAEDQGGLQRLEDIRHVFGETVASIVQGCSDTLETPKPPWLERKQTYIEHLRTAASSARLVSAADKLHNCRATSNDHLAVGEQIWDRFNATKEQVLWYYRELLRAFQAAGDHPELIRELDVAVNELHEDVKGASVD